MNGLVVFLIIFSWFYLMIGWGASLRVITETINTNRRKAIIGALFLVIAWPYILGVRLMG